jgi:uncharacterized protein
MLSLQLPIQKNDGPRYRVYQDHELIQAPPELVMIYLEMGCNMACPYCFQSHEDKTMTRETARQSIDFLLRARGPRRSTKINFFGGEPFRCLDVMREMIFYANMPRPNTYHRFEFSATTNGTIATEEAERVIRSGPVELLVSLDGTPEANHERVFLSGRPTHEMVVRNLARFLKWLGPHRVTVRMTFFPDRDSLNFVKNLEFVFSLGVTRVILAPVVEADWQGWEESLEQAYQALADWFIAEVKSGRPPGLEVTWALLRHHHETLKGGSLEMARPDNVGRDIAIGTQGEVMPSHRYLDRPQDWLGTVRQEHFPDRRQTYLHLTSREIERCSDCPKVLCGGGCRALSMQAGRGFYGHHPNHCLLLQAHARAVARIYESLTAVRNASFLRLIQPRGPVATHYPT